MSKEVTRGVVLVLVCWIGFSCQTSHGQEKQARISKDQILASFPIATNGSALLVPVTIRDKTYQFVLDTGSTRTVIDRSVPLGKPTGVMRALTSNGALIDVLLYASPKLRVGTLPFPNDATIVGTDLAKFRQVLGQPIYGVLGQDFHKRHVVRLDFDRRKILILKSASKKFGTPIPLTYKRDSPFVTIRIGKREVSFLLDTGLVGLDSGDLSRKFFQQLKKEKQLQVVGSTLHQSASGKSKAAVGKLGVLSIGKYKLSGVLVGNISGNEGAFGMRFLSRFQVTFDFPNNVMYLRKGKLFARQDRNDLSGLHILKVGDNIVVHSVDKDSPAEKLGIQAKDVLLEVGGKITDLYQTREKLATPGATISTTIRRGKMQKKLVLKLPR